MDPTSLALFAITFASVLILPGPNSAFVVGQSLKYGVGASVIAPLGFMSATGLHAILVFSGVGAVVQQYSLALVVLKWLGVLYLLYLAYKALTSRGSKIEVTPKTASKLKMYLSAMFVSLTNPKALLASLMLHPLFISPSQSFLPQAMALTVTAMTISFCIYASYGLAASALKSRLASSGLANKLTGCVYLGAAGVLASKQT